MYILLCGFPPFASAENNQEELFDRILSGEFQFTPPFWDEVSDAARELISAMLQVNPDDRFSAEDVLIHPWIAVSGGERASGARRAADSDGGGGDGRRGSRRGGTLTGLVCGGNLAWLRGKPCGQLVALLMVFGGSGGVGLGRLHSGIWSLK